MKKLLSKKPDDVAYMYALAGLAAVAGFILLVWFWRGSINRASIAQADTPLTQRKDATSVCAHIRQIDGVCAADAASANSRMVAIMIDNHADARLQSGLDKASVVYEAPVEGNYSRFMALYPSDITVEKAGPVRSARPYFLDWAAEYPDAMYMHVGGSNEALEKINAAGILDINEFYRGWYFWRDTDRFAPHNTYTSNELWQKAFADYDEKKTSDDEPTSFSSWHFDRAAVLPCNSPDPVDECAKDIDITFLHPSYTVLWRYDASRGQYMRRAPGVPYPGIPHADKETNEPIAADTVIVQRVATTVLDSVGRLGMKTTGSGQAIIFRDGNAIAGTWEKENIGERTRWIAEDGSDIPLKPGKIWIEVVNQRGSLGY